MSDLVRRSGCQLFLSLLGILKTVYMVVLPLLYSALGIDLDEELNSFIKTHCICWKLATKNGNCSLWMGKVYRNLDCSVDIEACLQTETPAGLNEV